MHIEIWSDIACPWCYLGKRRFEQALERFEHRDAVVVVWRSFELDPRAQRRTEGTHQEHLARKFGSSLAQVRAMHERMTADGAREGVVYRFDRVQSTNTFDAHRLVHLAAEHGARAAMVERLFAAYFGEGASLADAETLASLAAEAGVAPEEARRVLASDAYADAVRADEDRARAFGITGVPFFAIDERWGVSGAQPTDTLLETMRRAWREREGSTET